jgi:molybdenum cofactor cytidylyltransferase
MNTRHYAAIILAAGFSSRIREFKPLLQVGGETITDRIISTFLSNNIDVLLVTGWRRDELIGGIKHRDITIVENPEYESGMFSSIRKGVSRLLPAHRAFFIMPVDIPLVRPETIKFLIDINAEHPGKIIYPVFDSVRGHPPLIPSSLVSEIVGWQKDGGLKAIFGLYPELNMEVRVPDGNILLDIDNKEDYEALLERYRQYDIPTERECKVLLDIAGTPDIIRRHCRKVAGVAVAIAEALTLAGKGVDIEAVRTASILHDIAKGQQKHDITGGQILRNSGFKKIGDIVAVHHNLSGDAVITLEAKIVYLADKFVQGEELVSVEERYNLAQEKHGMIPEAAKKMHQRKNQALTVKKELETMLGYSLDSVIFQ